MSGKLIFQHWYIYGDYDDNKDVPSKTITFTTFRLKLGHSSISNMFMFFFQFEFSYDFNTIFKIGLKASSPYSTECTSTCIFEKNRVTSFNHAFIMFIYSYEIYVLLHSFNPINSLTAIVFFYFF